MAGPPVTSAPIQTAMNAPDVPMNSTCPDPIRRNRTACRMVVAPLTSRAANTAHAVYSAGWPAIWSTITTPRITGASMIRAA